MFDVEQTRTSKAESVQSKNNDAVKVFFCLGIRKKQIGENYIYIHMCVCYIYIRYIYVIYMIHIYICYLYICYIYVIYMIYIYIYIY